MSTRNFANWILGLPRLVKRAVAVTADVICCVVAVWVAFYLRLEQWILPTGLQWLAIGLSVLLAIPIFTLSGHYRLIFRYSGAQALISIAQAALIYGLAYASIITLIHIDNVPRTVGIIQPVLLFLLIASSRVVASWCLGDFYARRQRLGRRQNVMIYGAGSAGRQLFHALAATDMRVVGFVDDNARLSGHLLLGKPIYEPASLSELVASKNVSDILLAIPSASRQRRNEILEMIRPLPVAVRSVPNLTDLAQGRIRASEIRELDLDDLLGRAPVMPDESLLDRNIRNKVVLITGAGGSIGGELCRQVAHMQPAALLLVDISEAALYAIHHELHNHLSDDCETRLVPLLASVCDESRMHAILKGWRVDTIYHAAAYKHVPLVEQNLAQGVWNNVFGTLALAKAAQSNDVGQFVFISTDKAVRPTNVMGASKRLAEQALQALATLSATTCFSMVRFGNVLGSSGSVVPLFWQQIRAGGPITITHVEVTRYFMSIPEAAQLVIQAGAMAQGGEVFVLDMDQPVKILDLAKKMVEMSGLKLRDAQNAQGDIEFVVTGLRPGEKMYEELLIGNDPAATAHPRIMKASEQFIPWPRLGLQLELLRSAIECSHISEVVRLLRELVPEYAPSGDIVDWVHGQGASDQAGNQSLLTSEGRATEPMFRTVPRHSVLPS